RHRQEGVARHVARAHATGGRTRTPARHIAVLVLHLPLRRLAPARVIDRPIVAREMIAYDAGPYRPDEMLQCHAQRPCTGSRSVSFLASFAGPQDCGAMPACRRTIG